MLTLRYRGLARTCRRPEAADPSAAPPATADQSPSRRERHGRRSLSPRSEKRRQRASFRGRRCALLIPAQAAGSKTFIPGSGSVCRGLARFSIKLTRHRHCERSEKQFGLAWFPKRRGASPPPLWGRDRVGGRTIQKRLAPFSRGLSLKRNARSARRALLDFGPRDPPPRPAPTRGAGVRAPVSSNESAEGRAELAMTVQHDRKTLLAVGGVSQPERLSP